MRPYIYIQRLFTDNGAEEPACKFELIESQEHYRMNLSVQNTVFIKHFYLYMHVVGEQSYIKVYSLVFSFDSTAANKFTVGPVKKVRYLEDCLNMWTHKFIHYENSFVEYSKNFADIFRDENVILQKREALRSNQNAINEAVDSEAKKIDVPLYLNFQGHNYLMMEACFKDSVVVQAKSGNHFRLYLGKECVFEFSLNEEVFKHKISPLEKCRLVDIIDGVFRVECAKPSGESRTIHLDKGMPCIEEHFLVSILRVFLSVYDSEIYHALVRDVILNCLVRSCHAELQHHLRQPGHLRHRRRQPVQLQGHHRRKPPAHHHLLRLPPLGRRIRQNDDRRVGRHLLSHEPQALRPPHLHGVQTRQACQRRLRRQR